MTHREGDVDAIADRIARRRELQRLEEEALREGRIPPGQALTVKWPVLHATGPGPVGLSPWTLSVSGLVHEPHTFDWEEFSSLPRVTSVSDIHCVTRWSKLNNTWEGVRVADVLARVGIRAEARYALVHAPNYTANISLEDLLEDNVLFAFSHDGEPLTREHGGPVRLVLPKLYFWKSVKWVTGVELTAEDDPGFWEVRGYHIRGDPWAEERFSDYS